MFNTRFHKHHDFMEHRPGRPFQRGDFKYIILHFLKDKPSYGYEIMRGLQERFHSFYVPSPGSIYPTLQMLEEMGYVTGSEEKGKKVYTITEAGLEFLSEQKEFVKRMNEQMKDWCNPDTVDDIAKTMREFERLACLLKDIARNADPKEHNRIRDVLTRAYEEIFKK
ncbi:MAG: PadR family transcriptional regulator [Dehalococcoidia bacterium]|jgi:DNA-binding PadR family transcriptional regulator